VRPRRRVVELLGREATRVLERGGLQVGETETMIEIEFGEDHEAQNTSPTDDTTIMTRNIEAVGIFLKIEEEIADRLEMILRKSIERAKDRYYHKRPLSREAEAPYLHKPHPSKRKATRRQL